MTLNEILKAKEGHHFEFKEAKNHFGVKEATEYLCALANRGGGRLVLGVTDKRPRKVIGSEAFEQPESTILYFMDKLHVRCDFEIYEDEHYKRVLVFEIARRPVGLPVQFDGIAWWRDGDRLVPMPENVRRIIYAEGGYDFTSEICKGLTIDDLDTKAIEIFRSKWFDYSGNKRISRLSVEQLLRDSDILKDEGLSYAALILFGKRKPLLKYLPTAEVVYEFRTTEASGPAGAREDFRIGFFVYFDRIWELVNQRNENQHYQKRFQMLPVPTFNEIVVREAILNAVSHRNYQQRGSIFVRQYARKLVVESPGGFPSGVTAENILDKHEARNGLIVAVFQRCGLVERSGQGMNLIYEQSVREAKPLPQFNGSDDYCVKLTLDLKVIHPKMLELMQQIDEKTLDVMSTEDYLLLGTIYRGEDVSNTDPKRFEHLVKLEIMKYSEHGISPTNGGPIFTIGSLSEPTSDKLPINTSDKHQIVLDYMEKHNYVTTAMLAKLLNITQRASLDIVKKLEGKNLIVRSGTNRDAKYRLKK
ncbi:MAG: putative DNA binding domain-containing protein [Oscillospiraceae bacterium]|jgi:ATP-dependent DNA helicase RecG|nr:putative DNA binding domain-containing protein [Oscillospiraceae bacterium]